MEKAPSMLVQRGKKIGLFILVWAVIIWLLYPLLVFSSSSQIKGKEYFYRAAAGIVLLIILFGKTLTDLLFPVDLSNKKALAYSILLGLYSLVLVGGIIYMISRVILVYLSSSTSSISSPF